MKKSETIKRICEFARAYQTENKKSPLQLFAETGYQSYRAEITNEEIAAEIDKNSNLLDDWLAFTEDKRWTPSWGIREDQTSYVVFHVSKGGNIDQEFEFTSGSSACAAMVRNEMEGFIESSN